MRLSIIDRYIAQEIISAWLTVFIVLLLVVLSADAIQMLSWVTEGRIPGSSLLPLLLNGLYEFTALLIPLSLLLGILVAFGRLYKDSEMTAVMSAGLGPVQWYRPLLIVALPAMIVMFFLTLFLIPPAAEQRDIMMSDIKNRTELSTLFAGRFNQSKKSNAIFFMESRKQDEAVMEHVFYRQNVRGLSQVDVAERARIERQQDGRNYMVMENGAHYVGKPGSADYKITEYSEYGVYVPGKRGGGSSTSVKAIPTLQLWQSDKAEHRAELQWRLTTPVATLIIAMLALPLSHTTPRSGRYANLAQAIVLYLVYSNLLSMSKAWVVQAKTPVWLGTWWVHVLALVVLYLLLRRSGHVFRKKAAPVSGAKA